METRKATVVLLLVAVLVLGQAASATLIDSTWEGGVGNWGAAATWDPDGTPNNGGGDTYHAIIDDGDVAITGSSSYTIDELTVGVDGIVRWQDNINAHNYLTVTVAITNDGQLLLNDNGTIGTANLRIGGEDVTLDGAGSILFASNYENLIAQNSSSSRLTIGEFQTIATSGVDTRGTIEVFFINEGTIDADGGLITLDAYDKTNSGLMQASNGGTLRIKADVDNTNGTIVAGAGSTVDLINGHTLTGGHLAGPGNTTVSNSNLFTFDNVTLDNTANVIIGNNVNQNPYLVLINTITNDGAIRLADHETSGVASLRIAGDTTLNGSGQVVFDSPHQNFITTSGAAYVLTVGPDQTITTTAGSVGAISVAMTNNGTIDADGGTITLDGYDKVNNSVMQASNGGALRIHADVDNANGTVVAGAGSTVDLTGSHTLTGGHLAGPGNTRVSGGNHFTFNNVTLDNTANVIIGNNPNQNPYLFLINTITNNGTIRLADQETSGVASLQIANDTTLDGSGQVIFDSPHHNFITTSGAAYVLTVGPDQTITTSSGSVGAISVAMTNNGTIDADGGTLTLIDYDKVNNSVMQASNGGALGLDAHVDNTNGTVIAGAGSTVNLYNSHSLTGGHLAGPGNTTVNNSNQFTFDGLTLDDTANVIIGNNPNQNTSLFLKNTITNNGTIRLADDYTIGQASLNIANNVALDGSGRVVFDSGYENVLGTQSSSYVLTVGPDQTITTSTDSVGTITPLMENQGTIDAADGTIVLGSHPKTNVGLMQASNTGILRIAADVNNAGGTITAGEDSIVDLTGNKTITGGQLTGLGTFTQNGDDQFTLNNLTVDETATVLVSDNPNANDYLYLQNTIANDGTIRLADHETSGEVALRVDSAQVDLDGSGRVVFGSPNTNNINSTSSAYLLDIGSAQTITTSAGSNGVISTALTNAGTIDADAGGITLNGHDKTNNNIMRASNGGTLAIDANVDNTNGTIAAAAGSSVTLYGGHTITGGLLGGPGNTLVSGNETFTFNNLTLDDTANVIVGNNSNANPFLYVRNTITNDGTIRLADYANSGQAHLRLAGNTTLAGGGRVIFDSPYDNWVEMSSSSYVLTVGPDQTIATSAGSYGRIAPLVTNNGVIDADGGIITLFDENKTNNNLLQASNGGTLNIGANVDNTNGTITAGAGSTVNLYDSKTVTGGLMDGEGLFRVSDNDAATLNGVHIDAGATVVVGNNSNANPYLYLRNTITNDGTIRLADYANSGQAHLRINGDVTLDGAGVVLFSTNADNYLEYVSTANVLTVGAAQTIRSQGDPVGRIYADVHNLGTIEALDGSAITYMSSAVTVNNDAGELKLGTWRSVAQGNDATVTVNGSAIHTLGENTEVELSGAGSVFRVGSTHLESTLQTNAGTLRVLDNRDYTNVNDFDNTATGIVELGGGTFTTNTLNLANAGEIYGYGTITPRPVNTGLIRAVGGTLTMAQGIQGGSGTVQIDPGSSLDLSGAGEDSSSDYLIHNGDGLNLGDNDFLVGADYTNANWGVGNGFDHRTNVSGAGLILADPAVTQTLTGDLADGDTDVATMDFGNVHVGDMPTMNYRINNVGGSGPALRGAIQTAVNGGNLTDDRLVGAGVTADNFGPIAAGGDSGDLAVTFDATSAGELTGQQVHIANNFDNVATQILQFFGAAYRLANPTDHSPEPVILGSFHVGDLAEMALSITNDVPDDGFSEALNASIGNPTGGVTAAGSFAGLLPEQTSDTDLVVGIDTSTPGDKSGTATIVLESDGAGSSELGITALASQVVNVIGGVYRFASPSDHTPEPVNLGNFHVGDLAEQGLSITNDAPDDGYSEVLNASMNGTTGGVTASGSFAGLQAGQTNDTDLVVGIDTASAGDKSGTATIDLESDGAGSSELGVTTLASQTVNVTGSVYRLANPSGHTPEPVDLGNFHVGDVALQQALSITNDVPDDGYSEALNASMNGATGGVTASGSFSGLLAGETNGADLLVGIDTSSAGDKSGTATIDLESDGAGSSELGVTALASQTVNVAGGVYRLANPTDHTPEPVSLGNFHVGDLGEQALSITNNVPDDGYSEALNASIGSPTGGITAAGSFAGLLPGQTNGTDLVVGIDTSSAGARSGSATIDLESDGAGSSELGVTALASQTVNVTAGVYRLADPVVITPDPIDFGIIHVGDPAPTQTVTVANNAAADGYSEALNAGIAGQTGDATGTGSITRLSPEDLDNTSLVLGIMDTSTAGYLGGTVTIDFASDGAGSSGLGVTNLPAESRTIDVMAQVNNYAAPQFEKSSGEGTFTQLDLEHYTVDFGSLQLDSGSVAMELSLTNLVAAPADDLAGDWLLAAADFALSNFNAFTGLAAGDSLTGLLIELDSSVMGDFSGQITLMPLSENAGGYSGSLANVTIDITGSVVPEPATLGILALGGLLTLRRRRRK